MDWYLMVWRKFADFSGRSRRTEYWMFALFNSLIIFSLAFLGFFSIFPNGNGNRTGGILLIPLILYVLAAIIPSLAVSVRRLHDSGKSGWWLLIHLTGIIPFIRFIGSVIMIVLMCLDSDPGPNQYGPNPKSSELAGMAAGNAGFTSMGLGGQPQPFTGAINYEVCITCGRKLKDGADFCNNCGVHV